MKSRFTEKLDGLPATLAMLGNLDTSGLERAMRVGCQRHAIAIGSGGSAVSAEFFARCRATLSYSPTFVQTPLEFVLDSSDISNYDVWIFSAGADNSDVLAVTQAVRSRRPASMNFVTRNPFGVAAQMARNEGGHVHVVTVADDKDSYLATHSLVATVGALLIAAHGLVGDFNRTDLLARLSDGIGRLLAPEYRNELYHKIVDLKRLDTLIVLADPQLRAVSVLIETSIWETGICNVQNTDFRNFAHGRHTWLHYHGGRSFLLALTGRDSRETWGAIASVLSPTQQRLHFNFQDCGRLANAIGVVEGMVLVEAIGINLGVDPGKPGVSEFGRVMYENGCLRSISERLSAAVRQKQSAMLLHDEPAYSSILPYEAERIRLARLGHASFGGLVLDYDGTMICTENRGGLPDPILIEEVARLHDSGMKLGIATGRGGSAGADLRAVLDESVHRLVTIGYYNGSYITTLDVDIEQHRPPPDEGIDETIAWMEGRTDLFRIFDEPRRGVQVSVQMHDLVDPKLFPLEAQECVAVRDGRVRITQSEHSFDLVVARANKLNVVRAVSDNINGSSAVLCIGDSGSRQGNDYALLSHPFGISVGEVCDAPDGSWSLFGSHIAGPDAVLRILRALVLSTTGEFHLDVASLTLDRR